MMMVFFAPILPHGTREWWGSRREEELVGQGGRVRYMHLIMSVYLMFFFFFSQRFYVLGAQSVAFPLMRPERPGIQPRYTKDEPDAADPRPRGEHEAHPTAGYSGVYIFIVSRCISRCIRISYIYIPLYAVYPAVSRAAYLPHILWGPGIMKKILQSTGHPVTKSLEMIHAGDAGIWIWTIHHTSDI